MTINTVELKVDSDIFLMFSTIFPLWTGYISLKYWNQNKYFIPMYAFLSFLIIFSWILKNHLFF
jgi:hypothetical protein